MNDTARLAKFEEAIRQHRTGPRPAASPFAPLTRQTVFAITRQQNGIVHYVDHDGQWNTDLARAYILYKAREFKWFVPFLENPGCVVSEIAISIHAIAPPVQKTAAVSLATEAPVRTQWRDYVTILRSRDESGAPIRQVEPLVVSHHGVIGEGRRHLLTACFWRAVPGPMSRDEVHTIDRYDMGRCMRPMPETMTRVVTIKPAFRMRLTSRVSFSAPKP